MVLLIIVKKNSYFEFRYIYSEEMCTTLPNRGKAVLKWAKQHFYRDNCNGKLFIEESQLIRRWSITLFWKTVHVYGGKREENERKISQAINFTLGTSCPLHYLSLFIIQMRWLTRKGICKEWFLVQRTIAPFSCSCPLH